MDFPLLREQTIKKKWTRAGNASTYIPRSKAGSKCKRHFHWSIKSRLSLVIVSTRGEQVLKIMINIHKRHNSSQNKHKTNIYKVSYLKYTKINKCTLIKHQNIKMQTTWLPYDQIIQEPITFLYITNKIMQMSCPRSKEKFYK